MSKMDRKTLAGLTDKRNLSKLAPHRKLIRRLRRSGATLSGIAQFLSEEKRLPVAPSTVCRFIKRMEQGTTKPQGGKPNKEKPNKAKPRGHAPNSPLPVPQAAPPPAVRGVPSDGAWQKINALKQRQPSQAPAEKVFDYDPDKPLTLVADKKGT
jgi:DNA-binding transcriptional MerR regulator